MLSFFLLTQILSFIYSRKENVFSEGKVAILTYQQQKIKVVTS